MYGVYNDANPGFDYNVAKRYDITVSCTDNEDVDSKVFIVLIQKNEPPVFNNLPGIVLLYVVFDVEYVQNSNSNCRSL